MRLGLNCIVKNESVCIERMLQSVVPYISSWVTVDTGSTDDTCEKIIKFFERAGISGSIKHEPFEDWSQARNAALNWARILQPAYNWDYLLLCDADMELKVIDPNWLNNVHGTNISMYQHAGAVQYTNCRIISSTSQGQYRGVTHEYYDEFVSGTLAADKAYFVDYADGANRPEKYVRDIKLLMDGLAKEPQNVRYLFYLANTYADAGKPDLAVGWYEKRIKAGGWDEEVWNSEYKLAHCYKDLGREPEFVSMLLSAYSRRPSRPEPMYDLARYFREKPNQQAAALAFAEAVEHLPKSRDSLFVNDFVHQAGIKEEVAICSYYVPGKKGKGLRACAELAQSSSEYWSAIHTARASLYFYLNSLWDYCPSLKCQRINFEPPEHWVAMNPSVCIHNNVIHVSVRCVNYRMDDEGRYLIRHTETGEINNQNPINTRNYILNMGANPFQLGPIVYECNYGSNLPVEYPLVIGFEDQRIFSARGK